MAFAAFTAFGPVTVKAVAETGTVAIKFGTLELNVEPEEASQLCQDISRACLSLHRTPAQRLGMSTLPEQALQTGNADLVEVPA